MILPATFDVAGVADSYQGALILELASVVEPRFPTDNMPLPNLVVRSRIVRASPGARYGSPILSFLFGVGAAVFIVESQLAASGVPIAFVHAEGKKRWGIRFVGDSKDKLFADAAKLAGERVGSAAACGIGGDAAGIASGRRLTT